MALGADPLPLPNGFKWKGEKLSRRTEPRLTTRGGKNLTEPRGRHFANVVGSNP